MKKKKRHKCVAFLPNLMFLNLSWLHRSDVEKRNQRITDGQSLKVISTVHLQKITQKLYPTPNLVCSTLQEYSH